MDLTPNIQDLDEQLRDPENHDSTQLQNGQLDSGGSISVLIPIRGKEIYGGRPKPFPIAGNLQGYRDHGAGAVEANMIPSQNLLELAQDSGAFSCWFPSQDRLR